MINFGQLRLIAVDFAYLYLQLFNYDHNAG